LVTSVLVVAGNAKDPGYKGGLCKEWDDVPGLPNTVGIFTFQNKLKP
jgi:hypothetical protein